MYNNWLYDKIIFLIKSKLLQAFDLNDGKNPMKFTGYLNHIRKYVKFALVSFLNLKQSLLMKMIGL